MNSKLIECQKHCITISTYQLIIYLHTKVTIDIYLVFLRVFERMSPYLKSLLQHVSSVSVCQDKLNSWTQAVNFDGHGNLNASQVRCMFNLPKRKCMGG